MSKIAEDPIRILREEHDRVLEVLDGMEAAVCDLQGPRQSETWRTLQEGLVFLEREICALDHVEEEVLYPALCRHVSPQTIEILVEEHRDICWAMDVLARGLAGGEGAHTEVRWGSTALLDLLRRHIDKEDNVLFTAVTQTLSDLEYEDLARVMHEFLQARHQPA